MKFKCEQKELIKALNIVSRGVSARTTLPILKGIKITADSERGKVVLTASDLEIYIETGIRAVCDEPGEIVVSAKLFSDIIRKLNRGSVFFSINEEGTVKIENGTFSSTLQGIPTEDFPKIEMIQGDGSVSLEKETLKDLIKGTAFAASIEEARGIITGVLMDIKDGIITMAALDGFRMAIKKEPAEGVREEQRMIISGRIMNELGRILSDYEKGTDDEEGESSEEIKIAVGEKRVFISMDETNISVRLMEGEFIKYEDIIPKENAIRVEVDKKELLDCVDRASILVKEGKNSFIKFKIEGNELVITSRADEGTTRESVVISKEGEDIEIGFNGRFIGEPLKGIDDEKILMLFNKSVSPCLIRPLKGDSYEYLVLPVRLQTTGE
ncbi:MAG: DNA polymerase III subunit beta [Clostridiales Family XIII bacterium]|jgi:DNA polymerase-3 subunit beta|nr:DNA polymerase III subunit beta [Clostridiales Family XIII bacterium]